MPVDDLGKLGMRMRAARNEMGLTQQRLSDMCHVSIREIAKIENGEMISKADFAYQNGLSDSMFNDWVIKFESSGKDLLMLRNKLQFLPITLSSKSQK